MVFRTEKDIENRLKHEVRSIKMPDGSRKYIRMPQENWSALQTLLYVTDLNSLVKETQKWADKFGYSFEEYFPTYTAWSYYEMYKN